jgi:hypothetical protein
VLWHGLAVAVLLAAAGTAGADPIVNRNYAIELYEGVAIGDSMMTGMGGAGAANVNGSAGALINAAAPAVRRTTDNDTWSWDYHLDFLTGKFSSDYDNNGRATPPGLENGASLLTLGAALRFGKWSYAVTFTAQSAAVDNSMPELVAEALRVKLVVARWIPRWDLALGAGIQSVSFQLRPKDGGENVFTLTGGGLIAGATWLPRERNYRVALALESRIVGTQVVASCDPMACDPDLKDGIAQSFILPDKIESPGRTIFGVAYRFAATPWNQQVPPKFRDERSVTIAADLVIAGSSTNGHGIEAFAMQELQRSGAHVTASPRAGVEIEALPGRLRLRSGAYWEPERFEGVSGRVHGTFGVELRALEFNAWGVRRGKLGTTFDVARHYRNIGLSVGFWH